METWSNEHLIEQLNVSPLVARVRFSSSRELAQVDIYTSGEIESPRLVERLRNNGWKLTGHHADLPPNVRGDIWRHRDVSEWCHKVTQELVRKNVKYVLPSTVNSEPVAVPVIKRVERRLRIAKPDVAKETKARTAPEVIEPLVPIAPVVPPAPIALLPPPPLVDGYAVGVGSRVVMTKDALTKRDFRRHTDTGVIEKVFYWDCHQPTVRVNFERTKVVVCYIDYVEPVRNP